MRKFGILLFLGVALFAFGCSTLLPKSKETAEFYWRTHKEIEAAYNMIMPGKTTRLQLRALGFDPKRVPNAKRIGYLEVRNLLMGGNPNTRIEDLPLGAQKCLEARELCEAEIYSIGVKERDEEGNFIANKTNYSVTTRTTGWSFNPTIFIKRAEKDSQSDTDLVVYVTKNDEPNINKVETKKDKLGPVKTLILGPMRGFVCMFGIC